MISVLAPVALGPLQPAQYSEDAELWCSWPVGTPMGAWEGSVGLTDQAFCHPLCRASHSYRRDLVNDDHSTWFRFTRNFRETLLMWTERQSGWAEVKSKRKEMAVAGDLFQVGSHLTAPLR
ncbi:neurexin-2-like protein [Lates japonicus]|uniref:Neurexin-2-like protein n=1 Tax=Lates japonicus TaxID=270547 RepID=A0AAD3N1G8_LATJO|nr:neurexin-2-like protein [Lates japonicus]